MSTTWKTNDPVPLTNGVDDSTSTTTLLQKISYDVGDVIENVSAHTKTLTHAMETIFASTESQEKYSIRLSPRVIEIIGILMHKHPHYFRTVENTFTRIVKGSRIDATDVPFIISLITQLYDILLTYESRLFDNETVPDMCSHILKFVFCVIVRENIVKLENETSILLFLLCVDTLVDSCIKLIKIKKVQYVPPSTPLAISTKTAPVVPKEKGCC